MQNIPIDDKTVRAYLRLNQEIDQLIEAIEALSNELMNNNDLLKIKIEERSNNELYKILNQGEES